MLVVGITGVMGSGKSTVAGMLEELMGVKGVYYCDKRAKELMQQEGCRGRIVGLLGEGAYMQNGELDRGYVAQQIFSEQGAGVKEELEGIVHTELVKDLRGWIIERKNQGGGSGGYVVVESAILLGSVVEELVDKVVVVVADMQEIYKRVQRRDGVERAQVAERLRVQWSQEQMTERADYVIDTGVGDSPAVDLVEKVRGLNDFLLSLCHND